MDLTDVLLDSILEPCSERRKDVDWYPQDTKDCPWDESSLNPKNRINTLQSSNTQWRIDGCTHYGTRLLATPIKSGSIILRADVYIPGQEQHPINLRDVLQSSLSVCTSGPRSVELGIVQHVRNVLDYHVQCQPGFLDSLQALPFGSKLVIGSIKANIKEMALLIHPAYELERQFLAIPKMKRLFGSDIPSQSWPPSVDLRRLSLVRQLNDSVSLISIEGLDGHHVFKSTTSDPTFLYHELRLLLSMPRHSNIIAPPRFLVTKQSVFGAKHGVCGFILQYHAGGCLRDVLPLMVLRGCLGIERKIKWAHQITSALLHIQENAGQYYSDLRPDNVILTDSSEDIVLIDFEQRGNWSSWTAPEVRYRVYLQQLCVANSFGGLPTESQWRRLLRYENVASKTSWRVADNLDHELRLVQQRVWSSLTASSQASATAYSLGLLLFCIFEGVSNFRRNLATSFEYEPTIAYPAFGLTPDCLRKCIRECIDSPLGSTNSQLEELWSRKTFGNALDQFGGQLTRDGGKLTIEKPANNSTNEATSIKEIVSASWQQTLQSIENYLSALSVDSAYPARPSLRNILVFIDQCKQLI